MAKKNMVVFYGAGATSNLGFPTTQEFTKRINAISPFREHRLFNILIQNLPVNTDIEKILYMLDKLHKLATNRLTQTHVFSFKRNAAVSVIEFTNQTVTVDVCRKFLVCLFGIELPRSTYTDVQSLNAETAYLYAKIKERILIQYYKDDFSPTTNMHKPFLYDLAKRLDNFSIFTTNYDRTINFVFYAMYNNYDSPFCIDDGFDTNRQLNTSYAPNPFDKKLITYRQLHGSFDWGHVGSLPNIIRNDNYGSKNLKYDDPNNDLFIFPTLDPKNYDGFQFSSHMQKFKEKLDTADVCLVIGFSFRDMLSSNFASISQNNGLFVVDYINKEKNETYQTYKDRLKNNPGIMDYPMVAFDSDPIDDPNTVKILEKNLWSKGFPDQNQYDEFKKWIDDVVLA